MEPTAARIGHLLVPLDGSRAAEASLPTALAVARRLPARLTLLHVLERRPPGTIHGDRHLADPAEAERYLAALAVGPEAADLAVARHVHPNPEGDVAASIAAHAAEFAADLIVLASHGRGAARHRLTGNLAQQVVRRVAPPVLLVHPVADRPAAFAPRTVLVALDTTPAGEAVLPAALALAVAFAADLRLVVVVATLGTVGGDRAATARLIPAATTAALDLEAQTAAAYLTGLAERLRPAGVPIRAEVGRGDAAQVVTQLAAATAPSLLALATHGRSGFDALWTASVGSRMVGQAGGPLLLAHHAEPPRP